MLKEEFKDIISKMKSIYIFGAGEVGLRLLSLIKELNQEEKLKGFILTINNPPASVEGYTVSDINSIPKDSDILVSVSKSYHPEVYELLKEKGFYNYVSGHKFFNCSLENEGVDDSCVVQYSADSTDGFKQELENRLYKFNQSFGDGQLYQSLPTLGINGLRPTDLRIDEYGILNYINRDTAVLDIGCNCGFFDIELAKHVNRIIGIDINEELIEIANSTAGYLHINNTCFLCEDYNNWIKNNTDVFDVILSFSVHLWLDVSPSVYANQLNHMLSSIGYILFESHKTPTDSKYNEYVDELCRTGLTIEKRGKIKDDQIREREYIILKNHE